MANGDICDMAHEKLTLTTQAVIAECERLDGSRYEPAMYAIETSNPILALFGPLSQIFLPFLPVAAL